MNGSSDVVQRPQALTLLECLIGDICREIELRPFSFVIHLYLTAQVLIRLSSFRLSGATNDSRVTVRVVLFATPADGMALASLASRPQGRRHSRVTRRISSIPRSLPPPAPFLVGLVYTVQPLPAFTTRTGEIISPPFNVVTITGVILL